MKKIIICALLIMATLLTGCGKKEEIVINNNDNDNVHNYVSVGKYTDTTQSQSLKDYVGYYGDEGSISIGVFYVDDNTVNIDCNIYRVGGFYAPNVKIDKNGIGKFKDEYGFIDEGLIKFKEGELSIEPSNEDKKELFQDGNGNYVSVKKRSTIILTESELEKALLDITNNINAIDKNTFEVVNDGEKYVSFILKPSVYVLHTYEFEGGSGAYYEAGEQDHYYTIDKTSKAYISLEDLYPDMAKLNENIKTKIEEKKKAWESTPNEYELEEWPYDEFEGIGEPDYFQNYFKINEENKTVSIRVLPYPSEAARALGDIWVDVPETL